METSQVNQPVNILDLLSKTKQNYYLGCIFHNNIGKWKTKRQIEKEFALNVSLRNITLENIKELSSIDELIRKAEYVPGDIQRDLRKFYEKFKKYGLQKKEKEKNTELSYRWVPIDIKMIEEIIHPAARNIFKRQEDIELFCSIRNYECEMCGACKKDNNTLRIAVDHWRAHSVYNIDSKEIAVLLCEKCNNIHHNYDACKIAAKNKDNIQIIKKWIKKEKLIREKGYLPNTDDLKQQQNMKEVIEEYYKTINPLQEDFWEGLF